MTTRFAALDNLPLGLAFVEAGGRTAWVNSAARKLLGTDDVTAADFRVERTGEPYSAEALPHVRALRGEHVIVHDLCIRNGVGSTIVEISASPLDGGALLSIRDITHRKQIQDDLARARDEALRAARTKAEFLANVSHEIRTPLNGVLGSTGLLLGTSLTAEQRDLSETIRSSGETLLSLVNDILDLSNVEAGKLTIECIEFHLDDVIESVIEHYAARGAKKGIALRSRVPVAIPRLLRGDSHRIRQVLLNLVGNALKFTERGEILVGVMLPREDDSGATLRFLVTDTGAGIPAETQQTLFTPFTQADGSTTRRHGGSGLGLAVSKQIVEAMGGEIGLMSVEDEGSTFWFEVPLQKQPASVTTTAHAWDLSRFRALLVDANEAQRSLVARQLGSTSLPVTEVLSAREAREAAAGGKFDLIVFDMQLPDEDGLALAHSFRMNSRYDTTKLLLLTNFGRRRHDLIAFRNAGIDAFVIKPIRRTQLCEAASRLLLENDTTGIVVPPEPPPLETRSRVLVVEDNAVNQLVIMGQLERLGHEAILAPDGTEALSALERQSFDVVLMDCQMPNMDGFETARRIRALPDGPARIPIIAVTAHALAGERERCLDAGMNDYVAKPVSTEQLGAVIRLWTGTATDHGSNAGVLARGDLDVLDEAQVDAFLAMGRTQKGFLETLIATFRRDVPLRIDTLRDAAASGVPAQVALAAHALKSSSGTVGAKRMYAVAVGIEAAAREQRLTDITDRIDDLTSEFAAALRAYDGIVQRTARHRREPDV